MSNLDLPHTIQIANSTIETQRTHNVVVAREVLIRMRDYLLMLQQAMKRTLGEQLSDTDTFDFAITGTPDAYPELLAEFILLEEPLPTKTAAEMEEAKREDRGWTGLVQENEAARARFLAEQAAKKNVAKKTPPPKHKKLNP